MKKHGTSPNAFISEFGSGRAKSGGQGSAETHAKQLTGVDMDCGMGTRKTNDMGGAQLSHRGIKEAHRKPSGPTGY